MLAKTVLFVLIACFVSANDYISAVKVPGNISGIKVTSKAWMSANFMNIKTYPMVAIKTNDYKANKLNYDNGVKIIKIKALYDGKNIAFLLKWKDKSENVAQKLQTDSFEDGFGIEFPTQLEVMPYVDFGDRKNSVIYYIAKARQYTGDIKENFNEKSNSIEVKQDEFIFQRFSKFKKIEFNNMGTTMDLKYKNGYWIGSLSKPIVDKYSNLNSGAFIVSFSIYNGQNMQRGRLRNLSSWLVVKFEGVDGGEQLINDMSEQINADVKNGELLARKNCSICHVYKNVKKAPPYMAPDLSFVGGYGNLSYLRESILNPNQVQVEDFTKTAHPNFSWTETNEAGKNISIMPSFDWMSESEINNLLAFLQTLK